MEVAFGPITPQIPARDVAVAIGFYVEKLGFEEVFREGEPAKTALVARDEASIMLFQCDDKQVADWTAFRIRVRGIATLNEQCVAAGIVHPNGALELKPWGNREFAIYDPHGVCVTFWETAYS